MTNYVGPFTPQATPKVKGSVALWLGGLLVLAGIVLGVALVVAGAHQFTSSFREMQRVSTAAGGTISIEDPGTYRVFLERPDPSGSGGATFTPAAPQVTILDPAGTVVPVGPDAVSETYTYAGRQGRKLGRFQAEQPGTYRIRVTAVDGGSPSNFVAVGRRGPSSALAPILGGVFGGLAVVAIGVILLIIGGVRRSRSRRPAFVPGGFGPTGAPLAGWGPPPAGGGWAAPPTTTPPGWAPPPPPPAAEPGPAWIAPTPPPVAAPGWAPPVAPPTPSDDPFPGPWTPGPADPPR